MSYMTLIMNKLKELIPEMTAIISYLKDLCYICNIHSKERSCQKK